MIWEKMRRTIEFLPRIDIGHKALCPISRLDVDGLVWDRSATKVARSTSLADERALLRQIDAYVGSGGSEWAGSDTDSDDDFCSPSEGGSGDDYGAGDYL